jgi:hypothetical protein
MKSNSYASPGRVIATRAHVITGSFGSGKTTAIRWLMAHDRGCGHHCCAALDENEAQARDKTGTVA